ncbi:TAP-like protein-domain-containing protein [Hysterangium stoloniferum]|nr:TAP-like protein-domain-containing protein [Hysterangium stoloniferum]
MLPMVEATKLLSIILSISPVSARNLVKNRTSCLSPLIWTPCPGVPDVECASYEVPLDYANPKSGVANLAVARFRAITTPRLGTVFVNPGGPGGSGVSFLQGLAEFTPLFTNGQYDVVYDFNNFFSGSVIANGIEVRGNFTDQDDLDNFFSQVNATDELLVKFGQKCAEDNGAFLKFMGSTSVVRDMVALADCIEGPEKPINYYGISYGTVLGNYFRVGRVILDGVVDSVIWATEPSFETVASEYRDDELAVAGFAELCAQAGPQSCDFASINSTATSLLQDLRDLIDSAYTLHKTGQSNITSFDIRSFTQTGLRSPTTWATSLAPQLASWREILTNVSSSLPSQPASLPLRRSKSRSVPDQIDPILQEFAVVIAVPCLDSIDQGDVTTKRVFDAVVQITQEETPLFGEVSTQSPPGLCHRFPIRAVERFTGPFNKKLANTILVIGNRADPITPIFNARKIATTLGESARLLEQDGFGHTSMAQNSNCTEAVVRAYLVNGTLPNNGQICPVDDPPFPSH